MLPLIIIRKTALHKGAVQDITSQGELQVQQVTLQQPQSDGLLLTNGQFGCIGVSYDSGPPSTIWSKPLERGRIALLAINGADLEQAVELQLGELLGHGTGKLYDVRNVWKGSDTPSPLGVVSAVIPPHDCIMLVLSPK